jgi:uncharacterized protein
MSGTLHIRAREGASEEASWPDAFKGFCFARKLGARFRPVNPGEKPAKLEKTMLRENFTSELKLAMKAGDRRRVDTIRMITAALKDHDIEARVTGKEIGDEEILAILQKLVKSRQESMEIYEKNARPELAAREREEIAIISTFLPRPLSDEEVAAAIKAAIAETGAASIKDMGKVIAVLKAQHAGKMDFSKASGLVKAALAG